MELTKIICNKCGKEIHAKYGNNADGTTINRFVGRNGVMRGDLCNDCYSEYVKDETDFTNLIITKYKFEVTGDLNLV